MSYVRGAYSNNIFVGSATLFDGLEEMTSGNSSLQGIQKLIADSLVDLFYMQDIVAGYRDEAVVDVGDITTPYEDLKLGDASADLANLHSRINRFSTGQNLSNLIGNKKAIKQFFNPEVGTTRLRIEEGFDVNSVYVFKNGNPLVLNSDFSIGSSDATQLTLTQASSLGDAFEVIVFNSSEVNNYFQTSLFSSFPTILRSADELLSGNLVVKRLARIIPRSLNVYTENEATGQLVFQKTTTEQVRIRSYYATQSSHSFRL